MKAEQVCTTDAAFHFLLIAAISFWFVGWQDVMRELLASGLFDEGS